jgi:hypothetical protein
MNHLWSGGITMPDEDVGDAVMCAHGHEPFTRSKTYTGDV